MSIIATVPTATTNLVAALADGSASLHRVRGNGTTRSIPFYATGTNLRMTAALIGDLRDQGKTMGQIADALFVSVPTVRRMLNALLLAEAIEAGNLDGITIVEQGEAAPVVHEATVSFPLVDGKVQPTLDCTCGAHEAHSSREHFGWQRTRWTAALVAAHTA